MDLESEHSSLPYMIGQIVCLCSYICHIFKKLSMTERVIHFHCCLIVSQTVGHGLLLVRKPFEINKYMYICACMHVRTCAHTHTHMCMHACVCVYIRTGMWSIRRNRPLRMFSGFCDGYYSGCLYHGRWYIIQVLLRYLLPPSWAGGLNLVQVDAEMIGRGIYVNYIYTLISTNHVPGICPGHTTTNIFLLLVPNL